MLNNLAIFITEFNFVWVFFKMILDPQFLNCCEYTPALTKWALCCFFCQFQPAPLFPLLCVPLTSFFPISLLLFLRWLSFLSSTLLCFFLFCFFTSGSLLTRTSVSVLLNQGRGPPLCPPPCQPLPTLRQRLLVSLYSFSLFLSFPSSSSSSFTFWKRGFTKAIWPLHTLIAHHSFKISSISLQIFFLLHIQEKKL